MYGKIISIAVILTFLTGIFGCASLPEEHKGAATGAGIGAVTGAVAGTLLGAKGAKTEMAILGGLAGALAGGAIGHYAYDQKRTKDETAKKYNYTLHRAMLYELKTFPLFLLRPGRGTPLN